MDIDRRSLSERDICTRFITLNPDSHFEYASEVRVCAVHPSPVCRLGAVARRAQERMFAKLANPR